MKLLTKNVRKCFIECGEIKNINVCMKYHIKVYNKYNSKEDTTIIVSFLEFYMSSEM